MGKTAFIFPGQGAQYVGMGKEFFEQFEDSREYFDKASEKLGFDMTKLCFEENDDINQTEYTQVAILTVCAAILAQVNKTQIKPDVCAGLSLGEYVALYESNVLSYEDALITLRKRGILMQESVPDGKGSMSAVIGMEAQKIDEICSSVDGIVSVANYNCPGQIVITGETKAVEEASERLKEAGARRVIPLKVSGPFHSKMLTGAGEELKKVLDTVKINTPSVPYVANVNASYVDSDSEIAALLTQQISSPVKFMQSVEKMIEDGVDTFIEIGPGKTLSSFVKKINRDVNVINIQTPQDLEKLGGLQC